MPRHVPRGWGTETEGPAAVARALAVVGGAVAVGAGAAVVERGTTGSRRSGSLCFKSVRIFSFTKVSFRKLHKSAGCP